MLLTTSKVADFEKIDPELHFLIGYFREILADLKEEDIAETCFVSSCLVC